MALKIQPAARRPAAQHDDSRRLGVLALALVAGDRAGVATAERDLLQVRGDHFLGRDGGAHPGAGGVHQPGLVEGALGRLVEPGVLDGDGGVAGELCERVEVGVVEAPLSPAGVGADPEEPDEFLAPPDRNPDDGVGGELRLGRAGNIAVAP